MSTSPHVTVTVSCSPSASAPFGALSNRQRTKQAWYRISFVTSGSHAFCLFILLYTAFVGRRHGTQLLRAAANGRHPRGHHRLPWKRQNRVCSITRFANFIDQRSEIQSHILNHVAACKDDRGQRATLCELWREAGIAEQHRLENKAKGLSQNDFEEPLPIGALDGYLDKFEAFYHYRPFLTEILAEPLVGRLTREIDRTVLLLGRVRNNKESTKQAVGKRLTLTTNMTLFLGAEQVPISERPVVENHLAVYLYKVFWEGSWAVVGNFEHTDGSQFATLQACKTYVREFAEAATPLGRPHPPLVKVLAADEDTRALHAASLQKGLSLDLAIKTNEGKKAAL